MATHKANYFKKRSAYYKEPSGMPARYCRCLLHVASKQPDWCLKEQAWFQKRNGTKCYNPYALCTKSTRRKGVVHCSEHYALSRLPKAERKAQDLLTARRRKVKKEPTITVKMLRAKAKKARVKQPDKFKGYYRWNKAKLVKALGLS